MSLAKLAAGCMVVATATGVGAAHLPELGRWAASAPASAITDRAPRAGSDGAATVSASPPLAATSFSAASSLALPPDPYGQYRAEIDIEGQRVPVLVDTGATLVAFSHDTAARLGFAPAPSDYTVRVATANGETRAALIEVPEIHLGPLVARHVQAVVAAPGTVMTSSLLGMSFLRKLGSVSIEGGRLVLAQ